jgi:diguanylate cyclase (GGDEF)-like protein
MALSDAWVIRLNARRSRRMVIACAMTLAISLLLLGLVGFIRWRGHRALQSDTSLVATQAGEQLVRALVSRRGTLTFLRDVLNRRSDLGPEHLKALGESATDHTRDLLGTGVVRPDAPPEWWDGPHQTSQQERILLHQAIAKRLQLRNAWRVPSTFIADIGADRRLLVMLEPLKPAASGRRMVVGVFDFKPLLEDFFASRVTPRHPAQMLDGDTVLYRSDDWQSVTEEHRPIIVEQMVTIDSAQWLIQMQPGSTGVTQTLSWFNVLLIGLSVVAGLGVTTIVWILAARTWILQRAVQRRTAALRRTSERLRQLATTDELTGLYNRRFFLDRWGWEYDRAKRYGRPLACLMIDVNGFKQVNDRLGHLAGDLVLKDVAKELKRALRQSDILARFGGDEFIIALPETSVDQALAVAEKLRQVKILVPGETARHVPPVRLSVGISHSQSINQNAQDVIQAADQALYASKHRLKSLQHR